MEKIIFQVLASPPLLSVILLGAFGLGSIAMFLHVRATGRTRRFRRVSYVLYMTGLFMAMTGCLVALQLAPAATAGGWLGLVGLAVPLGLAGVGAGYVHAAAGRSMDIQDTTDLTWLTFVPFVALWLAVKRGMDRPQEAAPADPAGDVTKLALAALPIWLATVILDDMPSRQGIATDVGAILIARAADADQAAALATTTMHRSYFWSSFAGYPLDAITRDGNEIRLVYTVPRSAAARFDPAGVRRNFLRRCRLDAVRHLHGKGVVTRLVFTQPDGAALAVHPSTGEGCLA